MNVEPAIQLSVPEFCPSSTRSRVVIIHALPGELHSFTFGSGLKATVETALHSPKLERSEIVLLKLNVPRDNEINVVAVPLLHFDDAPSPQEWILRSSGHLCLAEFESLQRNRDL